MFKKIPYGVKVRVRGNEQDGFIAEYALCAECFLPFINDWKPINYYAHAPVKRHDTFPTFDLAKEAAMSQYNSWIDFYEQVDETKRVVKLQRKVVWKHP